MKPPIQGDEAHDAALFIKLRLPGVSNPTGWLRIAGTPALARTFTQEDGPDLADIHHLIDDAEVTWIRGIGARYLQLLEQAGSATISTLAASDPELLRSRLLALNADHPFVERVPSLAMIRYWINKARRMRQAVAPSPAEPPAPPTD